MAQCKKNDTARLITDPSRAMAFLIGFPDARVLDVDEDGDGLHISVETSDDEIRCPAFGRPAELFWQLRRWRCPSSDCASDPWTEEIPARQWGGAIAPSSDQSGRPA